MIDKNDAPQPVSWQDVQLERGFWGERQTVNRERTIPAVYHQTKITGRIDAWRLDWKPGQQPEPHIFWDSDTAKWMEAVAYSLGTHPNPEFERQVDEVVDLIERAQLPDGYANSHFIAVEPQNRWRNLRDQHELYCAGHLIEAAITYAQTTGKRKMLDVLSHYADYINTVFGPRDDQKHGYPGHPELELALVRLYRATGEQRYFDLSKYFIEERGQQPHYYDLEAIARGEDPRNFFAKSYSYAQAHIPIRQQRHMIGHSVRAMYLYSAATDIALETGDQELFDVVRGLWNDLTHRQIYVTGGVGSAHTIEGFTYPYDLPNEVAYSETCSSIALVYWGQRMFSLDPDSRYIDAMELSMYNAMMSGLSYEGTLFFQANPLAAYPNVSPYERWSTMVAGEHYQRTEWFDVACCPSNIARLLASVNGYFYAATSTRLYVQMYNTNRAQVTLNGNTVGIEQETNYPWDGDISLTVTTEQPTRFDLALRIPRWCREWHVEVNGAEISSATERGYLVIDREWQNGDQVKLSLSMPIERVVSHPYVRHDAGRVALQRGPIVYCLEEVDNGGALASVALPQDANLRYEFDSDLFGGVGIIVGEALRVEAEQWGDELYQQESIQQVAPTPFTFKAIPYCFWANREPGEMRVWLLKG